MTVEDIASAAVQPAASPAIKGETKAENMVPQSRLNEMAERNRQLQERLDATEKERQEQLEAQLAKQGEWKEIAEQRAQKLAELQPKADQLDSYEQTLKKVLDSEIATLPEEYQDVVPESLTTQQKLDWLAKNKSKFMKAEPFDIGAGQKGTKQIKKPDELTDDEKKVAKAFGVSEEEYAKNK
jgi:phage I-like protein